MSLQGKFVINNADYSPLIFPGLGTFLAFSGKSKLKFSCLYVSWSHFFVS